MALSDFEVVVRNPSRRLRRKRNAAVYRERKEDRAAVRVAELLSRALPLAERNQG